MVLKETTWKGLRGELSYEELNKIIQNKYEEDLYYDYDLYMEVIYKAINKKITFDYFTSWCVLVANCLYYIPKLDLRTRIGKRYDAIAWLFDGYSFTNKYNKKELYELIAFLKQENHILVTIEKNKKELFLTNNIGRYLCFDHINRRCHSTVYKVIVADYKSKKMHLKYVDDAFFIYNDKINYSHLNDEEFEKLYDFFFGYNLEWKESHDLKF